MGFMVGWVRRGATVALQLLALVIILGMLSSPGVHASIGFGYKLTSISNLSGGDGVVAHLKLIKGTEIFGADIKKLRLTAR